MNRQLIAQRMNELGFTAKDLADRVGISPVYLMSILRGLRPGRPVQLLLALALGVTVDEITGDQPPLAG